MKLSIAMIADSLKDLEPSCYFHDFEKQLNLERCVFFDGDTRLHADTLYLFSDDMLQNMPFELLSVEKGCAIVLLSSGTSFSFPEDAACIQIAHNNISLFHLYNRIYEIFEKYNRVDDALRTAVYSDSSMQQLIKLATPLFQNELTLRDREYRYVAHSYDKIRFSQFVFKDDEDGIFESMEEINALKLSTNYHEQLMTDKPWEYPYGENNMWCLDIFIHEHFVYRLKLIDTNQPFRPYDCELLNYLGKIIKNKYLNGLSKMNEEDILTELFSSLLNGSRPVSDHEIQSALKELDWNPNEQYQLLCLQSGKSSGNINAYFYYCVLLKETYKDVFTFCFLDKIILIVNLTSGYEGHESMFMKDLTLFLRENNLRAGISMIFSPLTKIVQYYQQASLALEYGLRYNPFIWLYPFRDYRYHYLMELIQQNFPDISCIVPEINAILENDRDHGTNYFDTLKCYLQSDRNVLQAAKKLNVHRTTLAYRLEKISAIMNANVDDKNLDPLLRLFFHFYEMTPSNHSEG